MALGRNLVIGVEPIRIFIGYDPKETVAYHVLCHSILSRATRPVMLTPVKLETVKFLFDRERDPLQSTEFSFSRFLTPWLAGYDGWAVFMDCDMLCLDDINNLWKLRDNRYAVQVVKHDHKPREGTKFLGQPQTAYPKKNWSSVMLFNCEKCRTLTPDYVDNASGLDLHQFQWIDEAAIGEIPAHWNHLVGYDNETAASLVHFTIGGPYFEEYRDCEYSQEWFDEKRAMLSCQQRVPAHRSEVAIAV